MSITFLEAGPQERAFYREQLADVGLPVRFVRGPDEVPADVQVLSTFLYPDLDAAFFAAHPALRLIAARRGGAERIDLALTRAHGVTVACVPSYGENTVAEHTFALILALSRRLGESIEAARQRHFAYEAVRGFDLKGKVLGVVGAGRIGLHTLRIARAFGMRTLAFDPAPEAAWSKALDFSYVTLDELLRESHIVSLHAALTPQSRYLLNADTLARCRPGVLVINTSRGALIDTAALLDALDRGHVAGAGLDVLEEEAVLRRETTEIIGSQIIDKLKATTLAATAGNGHAPAVVAAAVEAAAHGEVSLPAPPPGAALTTAAGPGPADPAADARRLQELECLMRHKALMTRPNVIVTPHVGFNSVEAAARIQRTTVDNIRAFLRGEAHNLVCPQSS